MQDEMRIKLGKRHFIFSSCHRIPERSFHFRGKPILCYRCLGLNGTFIAAIILQGVLTTIGFFIGSRLLIGDWLNSYTDSLLVMLLVSFLAQLPFVLDGTIQAITRYTSRNPIRLITGIIGGLGQFNMTYVAILWVVHLLKL